MYHRPFLDQVQSPPRQLTLEDRQCGDIDRGLEIGLLPNCAKTRWHLVESTLLVIQRDVDVSDGKKGVTVRQHQVRPAIVVDVAGSDARETAARSLLI